jgi:predicted component of type VI protein secretion system
VPDEPVSRRHAEIRLEDGEFCVYDMGSKYGTLVNGQKVGPEGLPLNDDDELALGTRTRLAFNVIQSAVIPPAAGSEDATIDIAVADTQPADRSIDDGSTVPIDDTQAGEGAQDDTGQTTPLDSDE